MYCRRTPASRPGLAVYTSEDRSHGRAASAGRRACQTGFGAGGPRSQALGVPGGRRRTLVSDAARVWAGAPRGGSAPPHPCQPKRIVSRLVFSEPGCVPRIGTPWKASHGRGGLAGGRSLGAAPLACLWPLRVFLLEGDARYAPLAPASRPARRAPQRRWVLALTPAPSAWASRRKQENQNLQRPAAQRPGERSASFSPPPLRRPWEAQPPLRDAAAHSPQNNASAEHCFFRLVALRARREVTMKLIMPGRLRTRSIAGLFPQRYLRQRGRPRRLGFRTVHVRFRSHGSSVVQLLS